MSIFLYSLFCHWSSRYENIFLVRYIVSTGLAELKSWEAWPTLYKPFSNDICPYSSIVYFVIDPADIKTYISWLYVYFATIQDTMCLSNCVVSSGITTLRENSLIFSTLNSIFLFVGNAVAAEGSLTVEPKLRRKDWKSTNVIFIG